MFDLAEYYWIAKRTKMSDLNWLEEFAANDGLDTFKKAMQFCVEGRFTDHAQMKIDNFHSPLWKFNWLFQAYLDST